jgi:hypothetical protein
VRQAKNQALFREVNDRIAELAERFQDGEIVIICECANTGCLERIQVALEEYARVRERSDWFVITPGHIFPGDEQVVEHRDGYDIIKV